MSIYRINYGNGQVSGNITGLQQAKSELQDEAKGSFLQVYRASAFLDEPGYWERVK